MKRRSWLFIALTVLLLFSAGTWAAAAQPASVYDAIEGAKKEMQPAPSTDQPSTAAEEPVSILPFLGKLVLSLVFIVLLIYLLLKFWATKTRHFQSRGPFAMIGGVPLGTNRSLQVVQIGSCLYILGVGENVQLIRCIPPGEEQDEILSRMEMPEWPSPVFHLKKWLTREDSKPANWDEILQNELQQWNEADLENVERWMQSGREEPKR